MKRQMALPLALGLRAAPALLQADATLVYESHEPISAPVA
jgi:hypothetical protein